MLSDKLKKTVRERRGHWFSTIACGLIIGVLPKLLYSQTANADAFSSLPNEPAPTGMSRPIGAESRYEPSTQNAVALRDVPVDFLRDELHIVTSPTRIRSSDFKWLLPIAGATAVSLATDSYTMRSVVTHDRSINDASNTASDVIRGVAIGAPVVMFGLGHLVKDEHQRETGILAGQAMIDAYVFDEALKYTMLRERPAANNARGHFFVGAASSDPSFISGHAIVTWSSAAVIAAEYNRPWQQIGIYTLASGASFARVLGQEHFPTDVLLGSAAGWLIGHYVYRARHHYAR